CSSALKTLLSATDQQPVNVTIENGQISIKSSSFIAANVSTQTYTIVGREISPAGVDLSNDYLTTSDPNIVLKAVCAGTLSNPSRLEINVVDSGAAGHHDYASVDECGQALGVLFSATRQTPVQLTIDGDQ